MPTAFDPLDLGDNVVLSNRFVFASLTRNRNFIPDELNAEHYAQRASVGLLLTEGTLISPQGTEWPEAPGIFRKDHVLGWKKVVEAVHAKGGKIFMQLWHVGRVTHPLHQCGQPAVGPSAIAAPGGKFRLLPGEPGYVVPEAIEDPKEYVELFYQAALKAKEAGLDGVELHAANGYLAHQFLDAISNQRTDSYGGSVENRARFVLEVLDKLVSVFGAKRVGIKLSPSGGYNGMGDGPEIAIPTYTYLINEIESRWGGNGIAYIQLARYIPAFDQGTAKPIDVEIFSKLVTKSKRFLNGDFSPAEAKAWIESGRADAVVIGRPLINNPDYVERVKADKPLNEVMDYSTWFGVPPGVPKSKGYTDY